MIHGDSVLSCLTVIVDCVCVYICVTVRVDVRLVLSSSYRLCVYLYVYMSVLL